MRVRLSPENNRQEIEKKPLIERWSFSLNLPVNFWRKPNATSRGNGGDSLPPDRRTEEKIPYLEGG